MYHNMYHTIPFRLFFSAGVGGHTHTYCAHHHHQLWPAFVPACLSLACGCYVLGFKAYLDVLKPKRTDATAMMDQIMRDDGDELDRPLLSEAERQEEDEFIAYPAPTS